MARRGPCGGRGTLETRTLWWKREEYNLSRRVRRGHCGGKGTRSRRASGAAATPPPASALRAAPSLCVHSQPLATGATATACMLAASLQAPILLAVSTHNQSGDAASLCGITRWPFPLCPLTSSQKPKTWKCYSLCTVFTYVPSLFTSLFTATTTHAAHSARAHSPLAVYHLTHAPSSGTFTSRVRSPNFKQSPIFKPSLHVFGHPISNISTGAERVKERHSLRHHGIEHTHQLLVPPEFV